MRIEWHNKNTLLRWQKGQAMQGPVSQKYNSKMKVTLLHNGQSFKKSVWKHNYFFKLWILHTTNRLLLSFVPPQFTFWKNPIILKVETFLKKCHQFQKIQKNMSLSFEKEWLHAFCKDKLHYSRTTTQDSLLGAKITKVLKIKKILKSSFGVNVKVCTYSSQKVLHIWICPFSSDL